MELKGTTAVITGSTGHLGPAISTALARAGCNCVCQYNKNSEKADTLIEQLKALDVKAMAVQANLTDQQQIAFLFDTACKIDTPRILINSASMFYRQPLDEVTFENARMLLDLNLTAAVMTSQAMAKIIKKQFPDTDVTVAKIINISDISGIRPWAEYVIYCSSKAALIGATKALAKELAPAFCVNSVAPGLITWAPDADQKEKDKQLSLIPMAREGTPEELARAIIFLLKNDYITGQNLNIDGGRCI